MEGVFAQENVKNQRGDVHEPRAKVISRKHEKMRGTEKPGDNEDREKGVVVGERQVE